MKPYYTPLMKYLVITESPAKIKKIAPILDKSDITGTFIYDSTIGHIINLEGKNMSIDLANQYQPTWIISPDKTKVVSSLKRKIKEADHILIASDPDLAGEFIAWSILHICKVPENRYNRVTFNAITKDAVLKGIKLGLEQNIKIDMKQVYAEQTRRLLDRLIGYSLSPIVMKLVGGDSAGRCQSPVARMVYEKDQEQAQFENSTHFSINGDFYLEQQIIETKLNTTLPDQPTALQFLTQCQKETFSIKGVTKTQHATKAPLPFNTMSVLIQASTKMGWSVAAITANLQQLYMDGHITYIRTDSTSIDASVIPSLQTHITTLFSEADLDLTRGKQLAMKLAKSKGNTEQQGHECIRCTNPGLPFTAITDGYQRKLYVMIWKQTLASLMKPRDYFTYLLKILIKQNKTLYFTGSVEEGLYEGFMKIYNDYDTEGNKITGVLTTETPLLKVLKSLVGKDSQQVLTYQTLVGLEQNKPAPGYYSEAMLLKRMKDEKIGRPATVKSILEKNIDRKYIEVFSDPGKEVSLLKVIVTPTQLQKTAFTKNIGAIKNKLRITQLGKNVVEYLCKDFKNIMDYKYTSNLEQDIIDVEEGKTDWVTVVDKFYKQFSPIVEETNAKFKANPNCNKRSLGTHDNLALHAYKAKFGPVIQWGLKKSEIQYVKIPPELSWETITEEQAITLLLEKKKLDQTQDQNKHQQLYQNEPHYMEAKLGRWGPFLSLTKVSPPKDKKEKPTFISLKGYLELVGCEDYKELTLTQMQQILVLIDQEKTENSFEKHDKYEVDLKKIGRFGPYLQCTETPAKKGDKPLYISIPKTLDVNKLTQAQVTELILKKLTHPPRTYKPKPPTKKQK